MKKKMPAWGVIAIGIGVGGVIFILGFYAIYYFSILEANEIGRRMACQEETADSFEGILKQIDRYEYNSYMNENLFGFYILASDSIKRIIYYQFRINENEDMLEFVQEGQFIKKEKGMNSFEIYSKIGETKKFIVPSCQE